MNDVERIMQPAFHAHVRRTFLLLRLLELQRAKRTDLSPAEIAQQLAIEPDQAAKAIAALANLRCVEVARENAKVGAISWRAVAGAQLPEPLGALLKDDAR